MQGHFNTFPLRTGYLFEVSRHGWSRSSSSSRSPAPAGWTAQMVATQGPCALAYMHSPLLGLTGSAVNVLNM